MKDSARPKQDDSATPVERPSWRFSGRRGTPVHLREQAPETLPPEIRKAVTQLARERAGETSPAGDSKPPRSSSNAGLNLSRTEGAQTPPVAAAPMPVERRADRGSATPAVPTSHIPAVATTPIVPQAAGDVPAPNAEAISTTEPAAAASAQPDPPTLETDPVAEQTEAAAEPEPVAEVAAVAGPAAVAEPSAAAPEPVTEQSGPSTTKDSTTPVAERTDSDDGAAVEPAESNADVAKVDVAQANVAQVDVAKADAKREQVTAAERKKRAKARAKARAKQQRERKKASTGGTDKSRRLFARGRDVDASATAEVEPLSPEAEAALDVTTPLEAEPSKTSDTAPTGKPTTWKPKTARTADADVTTSGADSGSSTDPAPVADAAPQPVDDLPDLVPSLDGIDEVTPHSFPAIEQDAVGDDTAETGTEPHVEPAVPTALADADHATLEVTAEATDESTPSGTADADADATATTTSTIDAPDPTLAAESAAQAAWELGRLPFLLHERVTEADASPESSTIEPVTWEIATTPDASQSDRTRQAAPTEDPWALPAASATATADEPTAIPTSREARPEPSTWDEPVPSRSSLRPIDWLPVGSQPTPAPIEPIDVPRAPAPDAIRRLEAPLELPQSTRAHAHAGAREGSTPNSRAADARRRIARRRAELDDLVHSLSGLGSGRRDS